MLATDLPAFGAVVKVVDLLQVVDRYSVLVIVSYHDREDVPAIGIVDPLPILSRFLPL